MTFKIPKEVLGVVRKLRAKDHQAYLVGGAVRDLMLKRKPRDWDVATDAIPGQVERIFSKTVPTGKKYGTVTVLTRGLPVQVTTFRSEGKYLDRRRPSDVRFRDRIDPDLARRDFTINAAAFDPLAKKILDPFGGLADLRVKRLRTVGEPAQRFREDLLRVIRAGRFIADLNLRPDPALTRAASSAAKHTGRISAERIWAELEKLLLSDHPEKGLRWLDRTGVLKRILPELDRCKGVRQGGRHRFDVFNHTLKAVGAAPATRTLRVALLLHDVAKPLTRTKDAGGYHFYGHDIRGAEMSRKILKRLKCPGALSEDVSILIRHHLFEVDPIARNDAAIRRLMRRVGEGRIDDLLAFRRADVHGCGPGQKPSGDFKELAKRVKRIRKKSAALNLKDLAVNGADIMKWLNIPPGPRVGAALHRLLDAVIDDPSLNTRAALRKQLKDISPISF